MTASTIRQKIEEIALEELGASFKVLSKRFDIEGNDDASLKNGISALWGEISEEPGRVDQVLCVAQEFSLKIVVRGFVTNSDVKGIAKVDAVYDALAEILKRCVPGKLELGSAVQEVRLQSVGKPEPFNSNQRDTLVVETGFLVRYLIT